MKNVFSYLIMGFLLMAWAGPDSELGAQPPKGKPAAKTSPLEKDSASPLSGQVVETMNSGGYTYVCLEKNGKRTWVAVPQMTVSVGQEISFLPGDKMSNFTSKSLGRTFDTIIFSSGPALSMPATGNGMVASHQSFQDTSAGSQGSVTPLAKELKVEKAKGRDAYTVGELYAKRSALNQKTVVVKGKVVKVSAGIMGYNWVHLQDGTGDPQKSTHDLVVTTSDLPTVGEVITVKGSLARDKDFGYGYKYEVIVEKATIRR